MRLEEVKDNGYFIYEDWLFKATQYAQGYERVCIVLDNGKSVCLPRDIEVMEVEL